MIIKYIFSEQLEEFQWDGFHLINNYIAVVLHAIVLFNRDQYIEIEMYTAIWNQRFSSETSYIFAC